MTWRRVAAGGAVVFVLALAALWFARARVAEAFLVAALSERTGAPVGLTVAELDPGRAVVTGIFIGEDQALAVARLEASYTLADVLDGKFAEISVRGLRLGAEVGPDGVSLGALDALLTGAGGGGAAPPLPPLRVTDAEITLTTPFGPVAASGNLRLAPEDGGGAKITSDLALDFTAGRLAGALALDLAADGAWSGNYVVTPGDLAPGPKVRIMQLGGEIAFARAAGAAAPEIQARLEATGGALHGRRLGAARATLDFDGTLLQIRARLSAGDGDISATFAATASPFAVPLKFSAEAEVAAETGAALRALLPLPETFSAAGPVSVKITARASGVPGDVSGALTVAAEAKKAMFGPMAAAAARLDYRGAITGTSERLAVVTEGGEISLAAPVLDLAGAGRLALANDLTIAIQAEDGPALMLARTDADLRHRLALAGADFTATLKSNGKPGKIAGRLPQILFEGSTESGAYAGAAVLSGGRLELAEPALVLDGIGGRVVLSPIHAQDAPLERAHITIDAIRHQAKRPVVVPLGLDLRFIGGAEGKLAFAGRLAHANGRLALAVTGSHDSASAAGTAHFDLKKLVFGVGIDGPETLFPILRGEIADVAGGLALNGRLDWNGARIAARGKVLVENLSADFGAIGLRQANTILTFDTGRAEGTRAMQEIAIGALDVGLPLTDGLAKLRIGAGGRLLVEEMTWSLAGGRVFARDFTVDPGADRQDMRLQVADLDLARLAALFQLEGISAAGTLGGSIPVAIRAGGVIIADGRLATDTPGVIRYKPDEYPAGLSSGGEGMTLALKALENFHYDELSLTLNRALGGETVVTLHLKGRNPELYDGYPIAFNLSLSGQLDQILQQSLEGYQVPERIRKRMLDFAQ